MKTLLWWMRGEKMIARQVSNEFGEWAFGEEWDKYCNFESNTRDLLRAWNYLHGNCIRLKSMDQFEASLNKMVKLWKERIENGQKDASGDEEDENCAERHSGRQEESSLRCIEECGEEEREASKNRQKRERSSNRKM